MLRIGLSGGIGAGKSTVARELEALGAIVIDSDKIAREVVARGTPGLDALVAEFGQTILRPDGHLDRPALASIAFADESSRAALNAITHPLVAARSQELIAGAGADAVIVQDIPLLVENHAAPMFHLVIIVWVDEEERVRRLVSTRGMAEADARARISAQATDQQRRAVADIWLDNSGSEDATRSAVRELWETRISPYAANVSARQPADAAPNVDDPDFPQRLIGRLWITLAADAKSVTAEGSAGHIVLADGVSEAEVVSRLADAGFAHIGPGQFRGSDPARSVTITVTAKAAS